MEESEKFFRELGITMVDPLKCHFLDLTCRFPLSEEDMKILVVKESPTSLSPIPSPEDEICMNCLLGFIAQALMPTI